MFGGGEVQVEIEGWGATFERWSRVVPGISDEADGPHLRS